MQVVSTRLMPYQADSLKGSRAFSAAYHRNVLSIGPACPFRLPFMILPRPSSPEVQAKGWISIAKRKRARTFNRSHNHLHLHRAASSCNYDASTSGYPLALLCHVWPKPQSIRDESEAYISLRIGATVRKSHAQGDYQMHKVKG